MESENQGASINSQKLFEYQKSIICTYDAEMSNLSDQKNGLKVHITIA